MCTSRDRQKNSELFDVRFFLFNRDAVLIPLFSESVCIFRFTEVIHPV